MVFLIAIGLLAFGLGMLFGTTHFYPKIGIALTGLGFLCIAYSINRQDLSLFFGLVGACLIALVFKMRIHPIRPPKEEEKTNDHKTKDK